MRVLNKHKFLHALSLFLAFALAFTASACSGITDSGGIGPAEKSGGVKKTDIKAPADTETGAFVRDVSRLNFSDISANWWDIDPILSGLPKRHKKAYTVMIYMNGSNLESEDKSATGDIEEMVGSKYDKDKVNVLIFTGGTKKWSIKGIPEGDSCNVFLLEDGELTHIAEREGFTMMDPGMLSGFIDLGMKGFPADKYGLIFWDHGGGTIGGFGSDEVYEGANLSLMQINYALENSAAKSKKFEFIGFDACLMASMETAVVLQTYADYLIASEDLEPGYGWDYIWFKNLSDAPQVSGAKTGKDIVDTFTDFYTDNNIEAVTTLSVIDLKNVNAVVDALDALTLKLNGELTLQGFKTFSRARDKTKTFGGGSPRESEFDMVDIVSMADQLSSYYPAEASVLRDAVDKAVVYYRNSELVRDAYGMTAYYIYHGSKDFATDAVAYYRQIEMGSEYTDYLDRFAKILTGDSIAEANALKTQTEREGEDNFSIQIDEEHMDEITGAYFSHWEPVPEMPGYYSGDPAKQSFVGWYYMLGETNDLELYGDGTIQTKFDGGWAAVNGRFVCMCEIEKDGEFVLYAIPAMLNGRVVDIIAYFDDDTPKGRIIGARPVTERNVAVAKKSVSTIKDGDRVQFLYRACYFGGSKEKREDVWIPGDEFIVSGGLSLEKKKVESGKEHIYCFHIEDVQQHDYYTEFIRAAFD